MNAPCQFCSSRWVTDSDRCHNHCDAYREYYVMTQRILKEKHMDSSIKQLVHKMSKSHSIIRMDGVK